MVCLAKVIYDKLSTERKQQVKFIFDSGDADALYLLVAQLFLPFLSNASLYLNPQKVFDMKEWKEKIIEKLCTRNGPLGENHFQSLKDATRVFGAVVLHGWR